MSSVGEIGYFQLSNLVRNKVPFALFLIDIATSEPLEASIESVLKSGKHVAAEQLFSHVEAMQLPLEHPFVLICSDGTTSYSLATRMVEKGFKNVYCIKGGWKSLNPI